MSMALPSQISAAQTAIQSAEKTGTDPTVDQMKELGTEFESVFLSMLLKEMRNSLEDGFFGGEGSDSFGGMFDLFIGQHLAKSNAIGVSDLLVQQYTKANAGNEDSNDQKSTDGNQTAGISFSA